jgi:hypothetical protein
MKWDNRIASVSLKRNINGLPFRRLTLSIPAVTIRTLETSRIQTTVRPSVSCPARHTGDCSAAQDARVLPMHTTELARVAESTATQPCSYFGFGGLVVSMLASGTRVRGFEPGQSLRIFFGRKNPQHAFLRKGSKAVCPMSQICCMLKNPVVTW